MSAAKTDTAIIWINGNEWMTNDWMEWSWKRILLMKWNETDKMKWNGLKWSEMKWNGVGGHKTCEMKENFFLENIVSGVPDFHPIFSV